MDKFYAIDCKVLQKYHSGRLSIVKKRPFDRKQTKTFFWQGPFQKAGKTRRNWHENE